MSKKKIFNLIELVIQVLLILSMVLLKTVELSSYSSTKFSSSTTTTYLSILEYSFLEANYMGYIALGLMGLNVILCLTSIFGNSTDRDGTLHVILPMITIFFGTWIFSVGYSKYYDDLLLNHTHKILGIACLFVIVILAIIKRSSFVAPVKSRHSTTIIQEASKADELKKYKELLDQGVISQEEFDAKKKQLLGL